MMPIRSRSRVDYMIIDFHVHIAIESQGMWTPGTWDLLRAHYPDKYRDIQRYGRDPRLFRQYLESQGIDQCVLLAEDSNETGIVPNDYILAYSREEPEFFIPFLALNPNKMDSFARSTELFKEHVALTCEQINWWVKKGFRGIKDYGSYNHLPFGHELLFPVYETILELSIPVLFHTGESIFDSEVSKQFANPEGLGILAKRFPELVIVIGHAGGGKYFHVSYGLTDQHPNVYLELSGVPPHLVKKYFFDKNLDLNRIGSRLIFGSDYPALPKGLDGIRKNIDTYRNLADEGLLTRETVEGLLGANALRILHNDVVTG